MKKLPYRQATTVISRDNDLARPQPIDKFRQSIGLGICQSIASARTLGRSPETPR